MSPKIMIVSVSAGTGHVRAAEALEASLKQAAPGVSVLNVDALNYSSKAFHQFISSGYAQISTRAPHLWGYMFDLTDTEKEPHAFYQSLLKRLQQFSARGLVNLMKAEKPDAVLCTHFLPPALLKRYCRKHKKEIPIFCAVTDFDIHQMWHTPDLDGYFVANDLSAYKLAQWGMDPARIHVTGIPVHPVFSSPLDRTELCQMYGLDTNLITFLFITGGLNIAHVERILNNIAKEGPRFQMILVTGRNEKLYHALSGLKVPQNVSIYPFGYVKDIEKLMTVSDLIITKPGGLTVSESLVKNLPLLMIFPIPGQEDHNADYILECGAGLKAHSLMELEYKMRFLLDNPHYIEIMKKKAERCRKPDAARDIIQKILENINFQEREKAT